MSDNQNNNQPAAEQSGTVRRRVVRHFHFTHQDGRVQEFLPGDYDVPEDVANHWFFAHHTDDPPEYEPPYGTPEHAAKMQSVRHQAEMRAAEFEREQREAAERDFAERQAAEAQSRAEGGQGDDAGRASSREALRRQQLADNNEGTAHPPRRTADEQQAGQPAPGERRRPS